MSTLIFDIETNAIDFNDIAGSVKVIHCMVTKDTESGVLKRYNDSDTTSPSINEGVAALMAHVHSGGSLAGHNIQGFDIPAIQALHAGFDIPHDLILDTLIISKLVYADLKKQDFVWAAKNTAFPRHLIGRHSLEAWGHRMGDHKGDYSAVCKAEGIDPWATWSPAMEDYCAQDVEVNAKLFSKLMSKGFFMDAIRLEHDVARIIARQQKHGFAFDEKAAQQLHVELVGRKLELEGELSKLFHPFYIRDGHQTAFKKTMNRWRDHPLGAKERKGVRGFYEQTTSKE